MIETIKKIVSEHTKISMEQLESETEIGRSVVNSSIILHRMYAAIAKAGIEIPGYQEIKTFGDLENKISGISDQANPEIHDMKIIPENLASADQRPGIGIDIEEISMLPRASDFREDEFYKMNYTSEEIAYCILQPDPYASFAGLFAAKEAIVKADNNYKKFTFNKMFIDHLPGGEPVFKNFKISISHAQNFSVAIAIKEPDNKPGLSYQKEVLPAHDHLSLLISIISVVLALIAICISIFR